MAREDSLLMEIPERLFKSAEVQCAREATEAAQVGISQCVGFAFWPADIIADLASQSAISDVPPGEVLACQVSFMASCGPVCVQ